MKNRIIKILFILIFSLMIYFMFNINNSFAASSAEFYIDNIKYSWNDLGFDSPNYILTYYNNNLMVYYTTNSKEIFWNDSSHSLDTLTYSGQFRRGIYESKNITTNSCSLTYLNFSYREHVIDENPEYFLYTNQENIKDLNGNIVFSNSDNVPKLNFNIELSNGENTVYPITAYSNYFSYSDALKYECFISTDTENWTLMNYETFNDLENNITKFRFNYKILKNDTYYFRLLNKETNENLYVSRMITNIIDWTGGDMDDSYDVKTPRLSFSRKNDVFVIQTQYLTLDEVLKYECYYIKNDFTTDYSYWSKMSIGSFNDLETKETKYFFFFTVPKDSDNCTYYSIFYDYNLKKYGNYYTLNCDFYYMNAYEDGVDNNISNNIYINNPIANMRNSNTYKYIKNTFGLLFYPIDVTLDFFERLENIKYSTPAISVPTVREPFTNGILIEGFVFNLNSVTQNENIGNVYNIYLIFVDFTIYTILFIYLYRCFKEFFNLGGIL